MTFAIFFRPLQFFQTFEALGLYDDSLTFDNFLTDLPTAPLPVPTSSNSTTIWAALVDESVNELVLSIEVSSVGEHSNLGVSDEHLNVSTTWLGLT